MQSVPSGTFVEVGVARDPIVGNCMHLFRYIGTVSPPFSGVPFLPPFTRQSIASLTAAQIASLQKGIQVMMSRAVTDPTSYRFQANIHGTEDTATNSQEMQSWDQCEHGSFYFFAWHRMYLYFFDRILRAAAQDPNLVLPVLELGGFGAALASPPIPPTGRCLEPAVHPPTRAACGC